MERGLIRVLYVEDNPEDAELLREALKDADSGHLQLVHVSRLDDALQRLKEEDFDVVLLDLGLPDSYGLNTLQRFYILAHDHPAVVLTGVKDEELARSAAQFGMQDFLVKGQVDGHLLARTIQCAVERDRERWA